VESVAERIVGGPLPSQIEKGSRAARIYDRPKVKLARFLPWR